MKGKRFISVLTIFGMLAPYPVISAGAEETEPAVTELVADGDFETGLGTWKSNYSKTFNESDIVSDPLNINGKILYVSGRWNYWSAPMYSPEVEAGKNYIVTAEVMYNEEVLYEYMDFQLMGGPYDGSSEFKGTYLNENKTVNKGEWTKISSVLEVPEDYDGSTPVCIGIETVDSNIEDYAGVSFYLDNVSVTPDTSEPEKDWVLSAEKTTGDDTAAVAGTIKNNTEYTENVSLYAAAYNDGTLKSLKKYDYEIKPMTSRAFETELAADARSDVKLFLWNGMEPLAETQSAEEAERVAFAADSIYNGEQAAPIVMDAAYSANENSPRTYEQVKRAAGDLRQDIAMVDGAVDYKEISQLFVDDPSMQEDRLNAADASKVPALVTNAARLETGYAVIIGTIGESALVDGIIANGLFDEAKDITGKTEAYAIKEIEAPINGVEKALVIAGSDARGTIYGIYTISEHIGVSPFYWYSDVPVEVKPAIDVDYSTALTDDGPEVKYRGIFINDEEKAMNWAKGKFPTKDGTPDVNYYRRVFELVLRMKANTLWPAMHGVSTAFNKAEYKDGTPINAAEAANYGVIMGASHCEILLRNNNGEWADWFNEHKSEYEDISYPDDSFKAYDYTLNKEMLLDYWRERLETNKDFESILTLGIRGPHDEAFNCERLDDYEGATDDEKKVSFMSEVITAQRKLIADVYGEDMAAKLPQVFIPYKEMNDVYNAGLNEYLLWDGSEDFNGDGEINYLDDNTNIMLMWAEDNENYLRQDLTDAEAARKGGAGIYYHISYWGPPSSYLWLNSTSLFVMSEEMHRGYNIGADDYWILNVGDIKPSEPSMEFFLKMAWDPESFDDETAADYLKYQAMRDYHMSEEDALTMAEAMCEYYVLNGSIRKAEFYAEGDYGTKPVEFSAWAYGDEALLLLERINAVKETLDGLYAELEPEYQIPFYEQCYYNVLSYQDIVEQYVYYWKNQYAAAQGRTNSANAYAELSETAKERTIADMNDFNAINKAKWRGFMDYKHTGRLQILVGEGGETYKEAAAVGEGIGAACENSAQPGSGTLRFNSLIDGEVHYFDVFDKNVIPENWTAETDSDWISLSKTSGTTRTEERVEVSIDWEQVDGTQSGTIYVYNADENMEKTGEPAASFKVEAVRSDIDFGDNKGYIEANGYAAIEAEHYSESIDGSNGTYWDRINNNGRHGDTMKAMPDTAYKTENWDETARLVYRVYFNNAGTYRLDLERMPVLNEGRDETGADRSMNVAVGVNGNAPQILSGSRMSGVWDIIIGHYETLSCDVTVEEGWNDIIVYMSDASFVWDRMVIETVEGSVLPSALGPAESPNNIAEPKPYKMAAIPEEILNYSLDKVIVFNEPDDVMLDQGKSAEITVDAYASEGGQVTVTAEADDPNVCEVIAEDNRLIISALGAGSTAVTVTAECEGYEPVTGTFNVLVRSVEEAPVYTEEDGVLIVNTADALANTATAWAAGSENGNEWTAAENGIGIACMPDIGNNWTSTADLSGAPSLNYKVNITNEDSYYVFVNIDAADDACDSYHVLIDGEYSFTYSDNVAGNMLWKKHGGAIVLSAGEHTITIVAREDGIVVNQLVLTNDSDCAVTDGELAS